MEAQDKRAGEASLVQHHIYEDKSGRSAAVSVPPAPIPDLGNQKWQLTKIATKKEILAPVKRCSFPPLSLN